MQFLPVPSLEQTLERYLEYVRPLLDDAEFAETSRVVTGFAEHDGPVCQEALLAMAERADEKGINWLTETWLEGYLAVRTSLPLSSNVGFELTWPSDLAGIDRAADLAHRFAQVHLTQVRGETPPVVSPRGEPVCMRQWTYLAGGVRLPHEDVDEILPGPTAPADCEILVTHGGHGYAVRVADHDGVVLPRASIAAALRDIVEGEGTSPAPGFSAWSYLGSDVALPYMTEALADPHNAAVHDRVAQALFGLALTDEPMDTADHLRDGTFRHGVLWPYKPVTYVVSLADEHVGMHIEHTLADGGTITAVVAAAQGLTSDDAGEDGGSRDPRPERLDWHLADDTRARLVEAVDDYVEQAADMRVRVRRVPAARPPTGVKVSHDAMQQFVLQYAQLATFGRIRSTYEAVDMREFQAGRTETMRPVSPESVALATALLDGSATHEQLDAASEAHRRRIIRCKTGEGVDRHLLGLRAQAGKLGLTPALFTDAGYERLTTDFLSTSSLGGTDHIARYAFAPTSAGGIGVGYNPLVDEAGDVVEYDIVLNHRSDRDADIDAFADALDAGARALAALVDESSPAR